MEYLNYFIRNYEDIDEFLYETGSNYTSDESFQKFDNIDVVIFNGTERYLPWKKKNSHKFNLLFRMCIESNKVVLACNVGFQIMYYFLSTNRGGVMLI